MDRRIKNERKKMSFFMEIISMWERKAISEGHLNWYIELFAKRVDEDLQVITISIEDYIVNVLKEKYEKRLKSGHSTLEQIEGDIWKDAIFENVEIRMFSFLDIWEKKYPNSVPKKQELQKLASDEQNVHTRVINRQTKQYMDIINSVNVPKDQKTLDDIVTAWLSVSEIPWSKISIVYNDMVMWGKKGTIFSEGDYLYRKVLRSLWSLIKTHEGDVYKELLNRLWEECLESVGMCGQGHISRLANVLVGFNSKFISPQSIMERFQEQVSEIAAKEISIEDKISEAILIMNEIEMPAEERQNWLDAF
jgi:hypothetical protein